MGAESTPQFSTTIGVILSCLGCVVGTGNIWRFPRIVANNAGGTGGLVFLIVWAACLFLWSMPVLLIEYSTGRYTRRAPVESYAMLLGKNFRWLGGWLLVVNLGITCYYSVVLGWCLYYFFYCMVHSLPTSPEEAGKIFDDMTNSAYPVLTHFVCVVLVALILSRSVNTFEKVNMVVVPILLAIVLFSFIYAMTLSEAVEGIKYLFRPEWSQFGEPRLWVDAISQNAWDTGAGGGLFIVYSIYMSRKRGVVKYGTLIPFANNVVSLICAMTTLSTVFHIKVGVEKVDVSRDLSNITSILRDNGKANTGLTFVWMPTLYNEMSGGQALAVFFFLSLFFAGLSSLVALMEFGIRTVEDFGVRRLFALPIMATLIFLGGLSSALELDVLVNQDFVWGFGLLLSGSSLVAMVIMCRDSHAVNHNVCSSMLAGANRFRRMTVNEYGFGDWKLPILWAIVVTFFCPIEVLGMLGWWIADSINTSGFYFFDYEPESLIAAFSQWLFWLLVILALQFTVFRNWPAPVQSTYDNFDHVPDSTQSIASRTSSRRYSGPAMSEKSALLAGQQRQDDETTAV